MDGKRLIHTLTLRNFLSFGADAQEIELQPLNVLIGPNASGKSNLLEALSVLQATPRDLAGLIRRGGGVGEWLWKGGEASPTAEISAVIDYPERETPLGYQLCFTSVGQRFGVADERVWHDRGTDRHYHYVWQGGQPAIVSRQDPEEDTGTVGTPARVAHFLGEHELSPEQSVLSQRQDPEHYPEVTYLGRQFNQMRLYTDWNLGRKSPPRLPQLPDLPSDFLLEDASNLGLVLNDLQHRRDPWQQLLADLQKLYDAAEQLTVRILGGTVQVFLHERGLTQPVPATRLSDGILRFLCLLSIVRHPEPPPVVCIEEPELGLHPDIIPLVGELLLEASERTQLVVTTHSETLVSALTEVPEAIIVCERDDRGTQLRRLEADKLRDWLTSYALGEVWRMGEIGGTRW